MSYILSVLKFGWPYMRRYWPRLVASITLGVLFGLSNASFVWVTRTLFSRLSPPAKDSYALSSKDVKNLASLAAKIKQASDPVSDFVKGNLIHKTTLALSHYQGDPGDTNQVARLLEQELNDIIAGPLIYEEQRFAKVTLRPQTKHLLASHPHGEKLQRLNRCLLEDAYETELARQPSNSISFEWLLKAQARIEKTADNWLPRLGRPLDWKQALGGVFLLPFMVALSRYLGYLSTYCSNWVSERVVADLRGDVLEKLHSLSLDYFNRSSMGDLLARIGSDTQVFQRCMTLGFNDLVKEPLTVICLISALLMVDWHLTLVAVVFVPVAFLPLIALGRKVRRLAQSSLLVGVSQSSQLVEVLSAVRVVKAFNLEDVQNQRYRESCRQQVHFAMKTVQTKELINPMIETIAMFGLGFLIIYIFFTNTSIPDLIAFITGVLVMFTPVKKLAGVGVMFQQATVSVERLFEVFREQPTVKEPANPKPIQGLNEGIVFENVSFAYGTKLVLKDVNLHLKRGMRLGIAGESGCGKSTMVNLVFRFYDPTAGRILVDGTDLREVNSRELRRIMALVSQDIFIFDQTAAENIACGRQGDISRAEIVEAARSAYAHDFISQLPAGYDSRVGERGVTLSGGQRQRLCIARAFARNAPILVLDEATGSLDSNAEAEVQAAIDRLEENRTVICIAHRLSTLANMDHIIVLDEGRIVEQGSFQELLRLNGRFARLARHQGIFPNGSSNSGLDSSGSGR